MLVRTEAFRSPPQFLPSSLTNLKCWFSSTRSAFTLSGSDVTEWSNAGPADPDLVTYGANIPSKTTDGGVASVLFDQTNSEALSTGTTVATLFGTGTFSILCCARIISNNTNDSTSYNNRSIVGDGGQWVGFYVKGTSSPVAIRGYMYDTGDRFAELTGISTASKAVLMMYHNGSTLSASLNNGTPVTVTAGALGSGENTLRVGNQNGFVNMHLFDVVIMDAEITASERNAYYAFCQAEYGA